MIAPNLPAEARAFRDTMGLFATGVAVIALQTEGEVHAMTANAVSSLSLDPMLLLFCPAKKSRLAQLLAPGVAFSVNLLRAEQQAISTFFAGGQRSTAQADAKAVAPAPPPFRFVPLGAAPRLEGSLATLGCTVRNLIDGGDHWIVIGSVQNLKTGVAPHEPLLFYRGKYGQFGAGLGVPAPDLGDVTDEPAHIFYDPNG